MYPPTPTRIQPASYNKRSLYTRLKKLISNRQFLINTKLDVSKQFSFVNENVESFDKSGMIVLMGRKLCYYILNCDVTSSLREETEITLAPLVQ
jgi:hypothetical protein